MKGGDNIKPGTNQTKKIFMEVEQLPNGQYIVRSGNLTLIQTTASGLKFNECVENFGEYTQLVRATDERFKPLFIALHNFKIHEHEPVTL